MFDKLSIIGLSGKIKLKCRISSNENSIQKQKRIAQYSSHLFDLSAIYVQKYSSIRNLEERRINYNNATKYFCNPLSQENKNWRVLIQKSFQTVPEFPVRTLPDCCCRN